MSMSFWIVNGPGFFLSKGGQHLREAQTEQREDEESSSQPPEIAVRAVWICARATHSAGDPPLTPFPCEFVYRIEKRWFRDGHRSVPSGLAQRIPGTRESMKRCLELTPNPERI